MDKMTSSPWKTPKALDDPILSLSNQKLRRSMSMEDTDRFIPKKLNFNTFKLECENKGENNEGDQAMLDGNLN